MPITLYSQVEGIGDGNPVGALPGTPTGVPRGLEATFSYNGLTLNDNALIDKFRVLSIDGLDDPDVRDSREDTPSNDGEISLNAFYGGRTLSFTGRVEAHTILKLRDMQEAIRAAFADLATEKPLMFLTENPAYDHFINCRKFSKLQWGEEQRDERLYRDFQITLRASNPRFLRNVPKAYSINFGADEIYVNVGNEGNYKAQPIVTMHGPIVNLQIQNQTTGKYIKLKPNVQINSGSFYKIDYTKINPTVQDDEGNNRFDDFDYDSDPFFIEPGSQIITFPSGGGLNSNTSANTYLEISFRDSWV